MKRRNFLQLSGTLGSFALLGGHKVFALGLEGPAGYTLRNKSRKLVLIQLDGGNDGLNTLIPTNNYSNLLNARPGVALPENKLLTLQDNLALHPSLSHIRDLFNDQKIMFIQGVGYPNPNLSHFRSRDIILSASASDVVLRSGWLGRAFQEEHGTYPENYPNDQYQHPLALSIGVASSPTCQGNSANFSTVIRNLNTSYNHGYGQTEFPDSFYGEQMAYISAMMNQTEKYLGTLQEVSKDGSNLSNLYPLEGQNSLADKLKIVANLISGGLETQVYVVSLGGFDTHSNQTIANDPSTGTHADLLFDLSQAIEAFQDDLILMGKADEVIGLVYSEFGRRIRSNGSNGTDHGTSWPAILFGSMINPVIYGENPEIPANPAQRDNLSLQHDFRSVYASVYKHWFEGDDQEIQTILQENFNYIPILKSSTSTDLSPGESGLRLYPYYCTDHIVAEFQSYNKSVRIYAVYNDGRIAGELFNARLPEGRQKIFLDISRLGKGTLHIILTDGHTRSTGKVFKAE